MAEGSANVVLNKEITAANEAESSQQARQEPIKTSNDNGFNVPVEPGFVVEDKTNTKVLSSDQTQEIKTISVNSDVKSNAVVIKPVFGREQAKKRLKALGFQKKIQMQSKNLRTQPKPKVAADQGTSVTKKDKPPTAHEKAKLTKEEIEKLKENQDLALPCLFYSASMIHHIRAEAVGEKPPTSKKEPYLTSSLEAIKNYEDQDEPSGKLDFKGLGKYRYDDNERYNRQFDRRNDRKGKPWMTDRDRYSKISFRIGLNNKSRTRMNENHSKLDDQRKPAAPVPPEAVRYTKTKPSISYSFNQSVVEEAKKQKIKANLKISQTKKIKKNRKKKKKRKSSSSSENEKDRKNVRKISDEDKDKSNKINVPRNRFPVFAGLSFKLDDLLPAQVKIEVGESIPFNEDVMKTNEETYNENMEEENRSTTFTKVVNKRTPDTDDYMANWEEDDEFSNIVTVKQRSLTPIDDFKIKIEPADDEINQTFKQEVCSPIVSNVVHDQEILNEEEIKDGLSTPIYVNPSPPRELLETSVKESFSPSVGRTSTPDKKQNNIEKPKKSPLFGMQIIYEQFIQSVNEAGIELPLERRSNEDELKLDQRNQTTEVSFTPNTSPEKRNADADLFPLSKESLSLKSVPSPSTSTSSSSTSSSSSSSSSSTTSNHNEEISSAEQNISKAFTRSLFGCDLNLSILSTEDRKKLQILENRFKMMQTLRKQSDSMDDEDIQCLLHVEKLIEAEKILFMRKYGLGEINESSNDAKGIDSGFSSCNVTDISKESVRQDKFSLEKRNTEQDKIFDSSRETIKLKLPNKRTTAVAKTNLLERKSDEEDQDFTEKLLKPTKETNVNSERDGSERGNDERKRSRDRRAREYSRSRSHSIDHYSDPKRRALTRSPDRRDRSYYDRDRRVKSRYQSPPRSYRANSHLERNRGYRRSRERSPTPNRKRPRSSYNDKFRNSNFRPPSPKSLPRSGNSRSSSKERSSRNNSPRPAPQYSWSDDSSAGYYSSADNFYYQTSSPNQSGLNPPLTNQENQHTNRPYGTEPGFFSYNTYAEYNSDNFDSAASYTNTYNVEYINSEPKYSRIPVINSGNANYYYNEFESELQRVCVPNEDIQQQKPVSNMENQCPTSSTFAVQKGNVLEIVPTIALPKQNIEKQATKSSLDVKKATVKTTELSESFVKQHSVELVIKKDKTNDKKKTPKYAGLSYWEDELAKRHVMAAVLRLNKDNDGILRGILKTKLEILPSLKKKKSVLFADGIPPGRNSSDEDISPPRSHKKRMKVKVRKSNKENVNAMLFKSTPKTVENKVDSELENLPPPPPPPGSPPAYLPKLIRKRPPSPEELLYFHYDPIVNSMYISRFHEPIPPRILQRAAAPILQHRNQLPHSGSPVRWNPPNISAHKEYVNYRHSPREYPRPSHKDDLLKLALSNDKRAHRNYPAISHVPDPSKKSRLSPNIQKTQAVPRRKSPSYPPSFTRTKCSVSPPKDPRPTSPMTRRFSCFNRPPPTRLNLNVSRTDFTVPPPTQPMLTHPSIPFGPRPPGGVVNFNRNVPPPFNVQQPPMFRPQDVSSVLSNRPPGSNSPKIPNFAQTDCLPRHSMSSFRPSRFSNPVNPISAPAFSTSSGLAQKDPLWNRTGSPIRHQGMCSFRNPSNVDNIPRYSKPGGLGSPRYPAPVLNSSSMTPMLSQPMGSPQFQGANCTIMSNVSPNSPLNRSTPSPNFMTMNMTSTPNMPPPSFSSGSMIQQVPRPNLGFPRSFSSPRPLPTLQSGPHHHNQPNIYPVQLISTPSLLFPAPPRYPAPPQHVMRVNMDRFNRMVPPSHPTAAPSHHNAPPPRPNAPPNVHPLGNNSGL